jgi:hypothetical protein
MANPESTTPKMEMSEEEVLFSLEILGSINPYAERLASTYVAAKEAHEKGRDLEEFLTELNYGRGPRRWGYSEGYRLDRDKIGVVLAGRGEEETSYDLRLGFVLLNETFFGGYHHHMALSSQTFETFDQVEEYLKPNFDDLILSV